MDTYTCPFNVRHVHLENIDNGLAGANPLKKTIALGTAGMRGLKVGNSHAMDAMDTCIVETEELLSNSYRGSNGRFLNGHSFGCRFQSGNKGSNGRYGPIQEIYKLAQTNAHIAIFTLTEIIKNPTIEPEWRIQACDVLLELGFGKPDVATLVAFEVDLILAKLGLPKRSKLRDLEGNAIFGRQGGFIPSGLKPSKLVPGDEPQVCIVEPAGESQEP